MEAVRLTQREAYALARDHLGWRAERNKHSYDARARSAKFQMGDVVWYDNPRRYVDGRQNGNETTPVLFGWLVYCPLLT